MNPLLAFASRFRHRPADPDLLRQACAATRKAWEEAALRARGTTGSA
jgi:hypothetical protein